MKVLESLVWDSIYVDTPVPLEGKELYSFHLEG